MSSQVRILLSPQNFKPLIFVRKLKSESSSVGRASAFQAECRQFEPGLSLKYQQADVAQLVERILGRDEVTGSNPVIGSLISIIRHKYI